MGDFGVVERNEPVVKYTVTGDGIGVICFNRPHANNAVHDHVYLEIIKAFDKAETDDKVKLVVLTGTGKYFCSGADLAQGFDPMKGPLKSMKGSYHDPVGQFMWRMITFKKVIVAAVNGLGGIGVGFTMLPHCDIVYVENTTSFWTPFTSLSVCPEFCSSYLFPKIMGTSVASEVLYLGRRLNAQEMVECGMASEVIDGKNGDFLNQVLEKLKPTLETPHVTKSLMLFKELGKDKDYLDKLHSVHEKEMKLLDARSIGDNSDAAEAVKVFFAKAKQKKKASKL